jgi:putative hydrolase of the HAD superfamily
MDPTTVNNRFKGVIFDLDNTLYSRSTGLFSLINERINIFIQDEFSLSPVDASALRTRYQKTYGITLKGLMEEHGIDPERYLQFVHEVPVEEILKPDPPLLSLLRGIPQPKYIFTNGSKEHAVRVLRSLGVEGQFCELFDISFTNYIPKPESTAYRLVMQAISMEPQDVVFVDDLHLNLIPAKRMGMTTILFKKDQVPIEGVDFIVPDLNELRILFGKLCPMK